MPDVGRTFTKNVTYTQSVLFDKDNWTAERARRWLRAHKYFSGNMESSGDFLRFRQYNPSAERFRYRNKALGNGIQLVVGYPK